MSNVYENCPKCGAAVEDGALFCVECGCNLENQSRQEFVKNTAKEICDSVEKTIKNTADTARETAAKIKEDYQNKAQAAREREYAGAAEAASQVKVNGTNYFVDSDEYVVKTLGNGYLQNIVTTGSAANTTAILTQKRLYFSGTCYENKGLAFKKVKASKIIDLEDITGTGFLHKSHIVFLILAILCLMLAIGFASDFDDWGGLMILLLIAMVIFFLIWIFKRISLFTVEYACGKIGFDVKWLNINVISDFQKQIHRMKANKKSGGAA